MSQSDLRNRQVNLLSRRIPKPSYRHAAPAGPWPYIDSLADQEDEEVIDAKIPNVIGSCGHDNCEDCRIWIAYPQSLFGNWTTKPVQKCGIERAVKGREHSSTIYTADVMEDGVFGDSGEFEVTTRNKRQYWRNTLTAERELGVRVRALFVDKMSGPVLQMLGTIYKIEPFFFSSSINWIPSRYQENSIPKTGDHITVTLTFIRAVDQATPVNPSNQSALIDRPKGLYSRLISSLSAFSLWSYFANQIREIGYIDPLAPLHLHSSTTGGQFLCLGHAG
jgi:hypothetical protein